MTKPLSLDEVEKRLAEAKTHVLGCDCDIDLLETAMAALKVVKVSQEALECLRNGLPCCMDGCEHKLVEALAPFREGEE